MTRPRRTTASVLAELEALGTRRHHEQVERLAALPPRVCCVEHGWSPRGPLTSNWSALGSLCPHCAQERKQAEREQAVPETQVLDLFAGSALAQRLWWDAQRKAEESGVVLSRSTVEAEALRTIDQGRRDEVAALRETPLQRRRSHREYWRTHRHLDQRDERMRPSTYTPHPARAGS